MRVKRGRSWSSTTATSTPSTPASPMAPPTWPCCAGWFASCTRSTDRLEGERALAPVPDLADGPPQLSPDGRTYTFPDPTGSQISPRRSTARIQAEDFVYAVERQFDRDHPSPQPLRKPDQGGLPSSRPARPRRSPACGPVDLNALQITLDQPANDSWHPSPSVLLASPEGACVPVRAGPWTTARTWSPPDPTSSRTTRPAGSIELVRNENWDHAPFRYVAPGLTRSPSPSAAPRLVSNRPSRVGRPTSTWTTCPLR